MLTSESTFHWTKRSLFCVALLLSPIIALSQTVDNGPSKLRVSGFGTLGITHVDGPQEWGYRRNISQPANDGGLRADIDSRVGVQLNYSFSPQFELVTQVIAKRRSSYAATNDIIEWAFAAYRPKPDISIRLGRLSVDSFLLADYRNVGFAYRFARPPVEVYGTLPLSFDGIDVSKDFSFENSRWRLKLFGGSSTTGDLSVNGRSKIGPIVGVTSSRESGGLTLRAGYVHVVLAENSPFLDPLLESLDGMTMFPIPTIASQADYLKERLDNEGKSTAYFALGLNYERNDWLFTMEVTKNSGFSPARFTAGYVGIGKRINAFTVFGNVGRIESPNSAISAPDWASTLAPILGPSVALQSQTLASTAAVVINKSAVSQRNFSVGARWDFRANMAIKVQWEHIDVNEYGGRLWSNSTLEGGSANVTSLSIDFVF